MAVVRFKLDADEEAALRRLWAEGLSAARIGAEMGRSRASIAAFVYRARQAGEVWAVPRKGMRGGALPPGACMTDAQLLRALAMRDRGLPVGHIARVLGRGAREIAEALGAVDADLAVAERGGLL